MCSGVTHEISEFDQFTSFFFMFFFVFFVVVCLFFFFFQAEDGIRDSPVTGVQTCALPICTFISTFRGGLSPPSTMLCFEVRGPHLIVLCG